MKFTSSLLALALVQSASAFSVQGPARSSTQLASSYDYLGSVGTDAGPGPSVAPPSVGSTGPMTKSVGMDGGYEMKSNWEQSTPVIVQGGSLRTCSFDESVERVQVFLRTEGRPLTANVELWQGPDNTPQKVQVYLEDGDLRPFSAVLESPGGSNAVAIRNTGNMEFPLTAAIEADVDDITPAEVLLSNVKPRNVQGGAVFTSPFNPNVSSVQVLLQTDGRPLNARLELLQGPNNNKQVMEVYTEDGAMRPFYAVIETPGTGNVVRIVNTATVEFPLVAVIEPYTTEDAMSSGPSGMTWSS